MINITNKETTLKTAVKYCPKDINIVINEANLTPENIVKGKNILGVIGTAASGPIYDNSIILNGESYIIDKTKPVLTDAVIIANPYKNEPEKITVTIKPTTGKIVTKKEGTYGAFNYHNRFYFDILPEVSSSPRIFNANLCVVIASVVYFSIYLIVTFGAKVIISLSFIVHCSFSSYFIGSFKFCISSPFCFSFCSYCSVISCP